MQPGYREVAIIGGAVVLAGLVAGIIRARTSVAADLAQYFPIQAALARDGVDGFEQHAAALARSHNGAVAQAARALVEAGTDLPAARRAFGELSRALVAGTAAALRDGEHLPTLYVFDCGMAQPYGRWIQQTSEIANPYMGRDMPRCGTAVPPPWTGPGAGHAGCTHGCCSPARSP